MPSCGWRERELRGEISHRASGTGTACTSDSADGKGWCLGAYSGGSGGPRFGVSDHRWDDHPGAPTCSRRKRGIQEQAIGRSRGGLSTKIHIAVDALGNALRLLYTAGQTHESTTAEALIAD